MTWDVVVVGAGPSGSLAARELAKAGASVLLLDRADFPRWKVCGACLSPGAQQVLQRVGLGRLLQQLGGAPLDRFVLRAGSRTAQIGLAGSVSISRSALDQGLVDAAVEAGARFWSGAQAISTEDAESVRRVLVRRGGEDLIVCGRVVIDATGLGRGLDRSGSMRSRAEEGSRVGLGAVFDGAAATVGPGELHMIVGGTGYVGLVRLEDGRLNVAAAVDAEQLRTGAPATVVDAILAECGRDPLRGAPELGWRGTPALTRTAKNLGAPRLFRLGDAAGYVEPFTGEGMCWVLSGATALTPLAQQAVREWTPELLRSWEGYQSGLAERSRRLCRALGWSLRRPHLVGTAVAILEVAPFFARPFVRGAARAPESLAVLGGLT
jgi:flavin-dependent dehydrogenase